MFDPHPHIICICVSFTRGDPQSGGGFFLGFPFKTSQKRVPLKAFYVIEMGSRILRQATHCTKRQEPELKVRDHLHFGGRWVRPGSASEQLANGCSNQFVAWSSTTSCILQKKKHQSSLEHVPNQQARLNKQVLGNCSRRASSETPPRSELKLFMGSVP